MPYIIAGVILLFLCPSLWFAYRQGLRDGLAIREGAKTIAPIPTPVQIIEKRKEAKEAKRQEDLFVEGFNNLMSYDGKPQKQGGENG